MIARHCACCGGHLKLEAYEKIAVKRCTGPCGGIWLSGEALQAIVQRRIKVIGSPDELGISYGPDKMRPTSQRGIRCITCDNELVTKAFADSSVVVDRCPSCGQIYLDSLQELIEVQSYGEDSDPTSE